MGPDFKEIVPIPARVVDLSGAGSRIVAPLRDCLTLSDADASILALARQEVFPVMFTDDLAVRRVAETLGTRPVGTVGILARAHMEGFAGNRDTDDALDALLTDSALFITESPIEPAKVRLQEED